ncbi:50S ribosomal protein L25 [Thalassoglobus polymorphus]|uniref:Large ribosomal subunit protein bL25 n=1 Tax=Thalassoglobus polymorphus TaxID=2527994 RepID=A0A517QRY8_9PLAN|nr:50S ribosomal protein L25 [Thalassoglobus polymorphus]QDT34387.1 50S ribosomal protein L25 [Thalassoglobus polymorphus]
MSTIEKIEAQARTVQGTTASRRLRTEGIVPGNLYGHKKGAVCIQLQGEVVHALIKDGAKVVDLEVDGEGETALLRDVQWDTFSKHILHVDFLRVDPNERVQVEIPVILRGTSPGVLAGGLLDHQMHALEIECLAVEIPDSIQVRIGSVNIGDAIHVSDLEDLPRGVKVISPEDSVVVQVTEAVKEEEPAADDEAAGEEGAAEGGEAPASE